MVTPKTSNSKKPKSHKSAHGVMKQNINRRSSGSRNPNVNPAIGSVLLSEPSSLMLCSICGTRCYLDQIPGALEH